MITIKLSRIMGDRRLTIQDVATQTGLSYTTVHQLYHDRATRFDRATLDKLCGLLGVSVGDLLEYQLAA